VQQPSHTELPGALFLPCPSDNGHRFPIAPTLQETNRSTRCTCLVDHVIWRFPSPLAGGRLCHGVLHVSCSEGWEQNGLYEFFRAKMRARRRKGQEKRNR
jgi:hypothetical protein